MKIDKKLNLVLEIERDDNSVVAIHHTPISSEIYKSHFRFISKVLFGLYMDGMTPAQCTRLVHDAMLESIRDNGDRFKDVEKTLLNEIWRLTNVVVPGERGWETVPFYEAMKGEWLSSGDVDEVKNYVCFFTSASWVHGRRELPGMYEMVAQSGVLTTSLDSTEYARSLPTSTLAANTGAMETPSSIPV